MRRRILLTVLLAIGLAACTSQSAPRPHRPSPSAPALTGQHACAGARAFNCSTLTVPLDYAGRVPGRLALRVAAERVRAAPHGVLLLLTGGPGQPGVPFAERLARMLGQTISGYQLVLFDQRGTGADALDCPALQREMGSSDLRVPTPDAVRACAAAIGPYRRFYATADVVADIDMLRRALRAPRLAVDGVSYGSYVAERYALAYRGRVSRLVLDSVVPQTGGDPFELANMQATAGVLRAACRVQRCSYDPAADLAVAARARYGGVALLDALVTLSVIQPSFRTIPAALHAARAGKPTALESIISGLQSGDRTPADELSQGLHASALCADTPFPWRPATPLAERPALLARALARLAPGDASPFGVAAAGANGIVQTCLRWPAEPSAPPAPGTHLPPVPVLLLAGDRDLSTPVAWARQEAAMAPVHQLVVVAGDGHSVQNRGMTAQVRQALDTFLHGQGEPG